MFSVLTPSTVVNIRVKAKGNANVTVNINTGPDKPIQQQPDSGKTETVKTRFGQLADALLDLKVPVEQINELFANQKGLADSAILVVKLRQVDSIRQILDLAVVSGGTAARPFDEVVAGLSRQRKVPGYNISSRAFALFYTGLIPQLVARPTSEVAAAVAALGTEAAIAAGQDGLLKAARVRRADPQRPTDPEDFATQQICQAIIASWRAKERGDHHKLTEEKKSLLIDPKTGQIKEEVRSVIGVLISRPAAFDNLSRRGLVAAVNFLRNKHDNFGRASRKGHAAADPLYHSSELFQTACEAVVQNIDKFDESKASLKTFVANTAGHALINRFRAETNLERGGRITHIDLNEEVIPTNRFLSPDQEAIYRELVCN